MASSTHLSGFWAWGIRIFLVPHVLIGVAFLGLMLASPVWAYWGRDVPGIVYATRKTEDANGGKAYYLSYRYELGGRTYQREGSVPQAVYRRYAMPATVERAPSPVAVHVLSIGPWHYAAPIGEGDSPWSSVGFVWAFGVIWNVLVAIPAYLLYVRPFLRWRRWRRLMAARRAASPGS